MLAKESKEAFENLRDEIDRLESKIEENHAEEAGYLVDFKTKIRDMAIE